MSLAIDLLQQCSKLSQVEARRHDDIATERDNEAADIRGHVVDIQRDIDDLNDQIVSANRMVGTFAVHSCCERSAIDVCTNMCF